MGQDIFYLSGYLFWQPVVWLPRELIAHALIYQHLAKVVIAGLLFFWFLQLRDLGFAVSLLGSFLLSFSAYMCMGSCWFILADEVVGFTAILFSAELALKRGNWWPLVLAVMMTGLIGVFYLYLCALFLSIYVPARLLGQYGWRPRLILRVCFALALAAVLGAGLSAMVTLPHLYGVLNSPRGSGTVSVIPKIPIFWFQSNLHYFTALLRPFANDILGAGDNYYGWRNYLEAPLSYCGLVSLLLFPQAFVGASRRHKIIYCIFLAGAIIPIIFPWFRYLFWLFEGDYYRTYSLFSVFGMITLAMVALSRFTKGRPLSFWLLLATILVLLGIVFWPFGELQSHIDPNIRRAAVLYLLAYAALLTAGQLLKRQRLATCALVSLTAVELIWLDWNTVSNRKTISKHEIRERVGYDDETLDAVRDINAGDSSFFRITKLVPYHRALLYDSSNLNDAMVFGYYGSSSYSSFNNLNYTNFLVAVNAIPSNSEPDTRWSMGLLNSPILSLFACEKYILVDNPVPFEIAPQYASLKRYGKSYLFHNTQFLPLGLTFDRYISEDNFLKLTPREKSQAILYAAVLPNKTRTENLSLPPTTASDLEEAIKDSSLEDLIATRRNAAAKLTSFHQTRIEWKVFLDQKTIFVVQTPFDYGWHAFQDDHVMPVLKVDGGLLGVILDPGEHKVELSYRNPYLIAGMAITSASLLLLAGALWRWPRMRLIA